MRELRLLAMVGLLACVACGGEDPAGPGDDGDDPVPKATAPGTPDGAPTTALIGAAGGTLASSDGRFSIEVPPGALAADTEIAVQPITNTAWGGIGKGYRLTPDGLTFTRPIDVSFDVAPEDLSGSSAEFLGVAFQTGDGLWHSLNNSSYSEAEGALTAQTTHFTDFSQFAGLQLRPGSASVGTSGTVDLNVRYCHGETGDELVSLVFSCDEDLVPLGTFSGWSVNGIPGGNSSVGRVAELGGGRARYTAPAGVPQANPVAVSVATRVNGRSGLLVCNVTVGGTWFGTATVDRGHGERTVATVVWESAGTFQNIETFRAIGTVTYTPDQDYGESCTFVSLTPNTATIDSFDGHLVIDHSTTPATFYGGGNTPLQASLCFTCDGWEQPECQDDLYFLTWLNADQEDGWAVSQDGQRISRTWYDGSIEDGVVYTIEFQRGVPPPAMTAMVSALRGG